MNPQLSEFVQNPLAVKVDSTNMDTNMETDIRELKDTAVQKPWLKRAGDQLAKTPQETKRRRKNYVLKRLVAPKFPLMILNELKPGLQFTISEQTDSNPLQFVAAVEVDGNLFRGQGMSKKQAQQEAAEAVLKGLYFDKLLEQHPKKEQDTDIQMKDESFQSTESEGKAGNSPCPEDDTPWSALASLAMYKLINLWQKPDLPKVAPGNEKVSSPNLKSKLPANASEADPVMILLQISPTSKFFEKARDIQNGTTVFTMSVEFNGQTFEGSALQKKKSKEGVCESCIENSWSSIFRLISLVVMIEFCVFIRQIVIWRLDLVQD